MPTTRRRFLASLSAAVCAPALLTAATRLARYPIAFSTLGCPKWDWKTILQNAARWGYAAVEVRGLQGEMDLTKRPEFAEGRAADTLKELENLGLRISDLGSSARMHESDPRARQGQMDEGKRFVDLAHRLKVPYVRVFGDRVVPGRPKQESLERVIAGLRELGGHAKGSGVMVLLESHGDFCDSPTLQQIMTGAAGENVALLWDAHHTVVAGHENPELTWKALGRYVRHVHLKDSRPEGKDVRYVLTGQGTIPLREIARVLAEHKFAGYYSFEWEKAWHPEIEEPEVAFPDFAKQMTEYLKEAGLQPDKG